MTNKEDLIQTMIHGDVSTAMVDLFVEALSRFPEGALKQAADYGVHIEYVGDRTWDDINKDIEVLIGPSRENAIGMYRADLKTIYIKELSKWSIIHEFAHALDFMVGSRTEHEDPYGYPQPFSAYDRHFRRDAAAHMASVMFAGKPEEEFITGYAANSAFNGISQGMPDIFAEAVAAFMDSTTLNNSTVGLHSMQPRKWLRVFDPEMYDRIETFLKALDEGRLPTHNFAGPVHDFFNVHTQGAELLVKDDVPHSALGHSASTGSTL